MRVFVMFVALSHVNQICSYKHAFNKHSNVGRSSYTTKSSDCTGHVQCFIGMATYTNHWGRIYWSRTLLMLLTTLLSSLYQVAIYPPHTLSHRGVLALSSGLLHQLSVVNSSIGKETEWVDYKNNVLRNPLQLSKRVIDSIILFPTSLDNIDHCLWCTFVF